MESSLCLYYGQYFLDIFGWGIELASWLYGVVGAVALLITRHA
jgi:hypothetical protein